MVVLKKGTEDKIAAFAAQGAFFILMSVFPFAIFLLQIMRFAPISQESLLMSVDSIFPEYLLPTLHEILQEIFSTSTNYVPLSFITTLWASSNAMFALAQGLDLICSARNARNSFVNRMWALVYTIVVALLLIVTAGSAVFWSSIRHILMHHRPRGIPLSIYTSVIKTIYMLLVLTIAFMLMYKAFPHKKLSFIKQLPGALFAALGWYLSSVGITIYVTNFNAVSMYGSLTTLALVMFWLYFCNYFIMLGAEINEILRRHFEDSA